MKQALVTGSGGFVGRHMHDELRRRGWYAMQCEILEPCYLDALDVFRDDDGFDLIVHCAYHVGGRAGIDGNKANLAKNLHLDAAMFEWAVRTKTAVLYFSSSAVYPVNVQTKEFHRRLMERDPALAPPDGDYGFAKLAGERMAANAKALGLPVYVVRPFSGYGLDQSEDYPFPAFVKRAREKQSPFEIWGDPDSCRDWIHISDVVNGALAVVEADYREPVNLCTGKATSFRELAKLCMDATGYEAPIKSVDGPQGVFYRVGDPTLMRKFYEPKITLESVLKA